MYHSLNNKPARQNERQYPAACETSGESKSCFQLKDNRSSSVTQREHVEAMAGGSPAQRKKNNTGLPDQLKSGVENLSGHSMDDVKVHYNSDKPAQLNAHAYAQGTDIHLAPGQEKHLPHEAWHVAQQKQGRVRPTLQMKGKVNINDDEGLEKEADVMGNNSLNYAGKVMPEVNGAAPLKSNAIFQLCNSGDIMQFAKPINDIFNFIDQNNQKLGAVGGIELKRLLYWNDLGHFDQDKGGILNLKTVRKAMGKKIPMEDKPDEAALPEWMEVRTSFKVDLPAFFGGGKLMFPRLSGNVVFEGRGWISNNIYWRGPNPPRVKYMIHAILEWAGQNVQGEPTPHITLRNAETQALIDLDTSNPKAEPRVEGLTATRTSFSQGLGVNRQPGITMTRDDETFDNLKSGAVQEWLRNLSDAAQGALLPELQEV